MNWRGLENPFLRHPAASLVLLLLCCLPVLVDLPKLEIRPDARILLEGDQRNLAAYDKVSEILNRDIVVVISMEGTHLYSQQGFDDLRLLCDRLSILKGMVDVKSLTHSVKPVRKGLSFDMVKFVPEGQLEREDIERIKQFCLSHPLVRNVMVSEDGRHFLITATFQRECATQEQRSELKADVEGVLGGFEPLGYRFRSIALPFVEEEVYRTLKHDLTLTALTAFAFTVGILWFAYRSVGALLLILLNIALTQLGLAGLMQVCGVAVTIYTAMLFPLLAGVHLTLLVHVFCAFAPTEARCPVGEAANRVFKSSAFASLTTLVGMASLALCDVPEVRRFGLMGALGVLAVFAWTFGPGLSLHKLASERGLVSPTPEAGHSGGYSKRLASWVRRHQGRILKMGAAGCVGGALGCAFLRTDVRVVEFLAKGSPTRQALEEMNQVYGGVNVIQIEIDTAKANGLADLVVLRYLDGLSRFALDQPNVTGSYSFAGLLGMMNQIWEQENPGSMALPDSALKVNLFVAALKTRNYPFLTALTDSDLRRAYLVVRSRDMPAKDYLDTIQRIMEKARSACPAGVSVSARDGIHSIVEADQRIVRAQRNTGLLTLMVIWLVLAGLWRSPWLGASAVGVNLIPIGLIAAVAAACGITLNSVTVMLAVLVFGIAVDDSVHLITTWREDGSGGYEALVAVYRAKGRPILITSAILVGVMLPFALLSFPPVRDFGVLAALGFATAVLGVVFVIPAVLMRND